jgi:ATP-dependent Clp protease ATP-binding subunit ClpA
MDTFVKRLGGSQIADLMHGGMGFIQPKDKATTGLYEKVESTAVEAARRTFSVEFMNRLDKVVVFHPLSARSLTKCSRSNSGKYRSACWTRRFAPSSFESRAKAGSSS